MERGLNICSCPCCAEQFDKESGLLMVASEVWFYCGGVWVAGSYFNFGFDWIGSRSGHYLSLNGSKSQIQMCNDAFHYSNLVTLC